MSTESKSVSPTRMAYVRAVEDTLTDAELVFVIGRRVRRNHYFQLVMGALSNIAGAAWDDGNVQGQIDGAETAALNAQKTEAAA